MTHKAVEVVPAILRKAYEDIEREWKIVQSDATHIQIDITDGLFAGDGTYRDIKRFKQLPESEKIELHLMVHTPGRYVDEIIDLNPARCIFHLEAFVGTDDLRLVYTTLREKTTSELALALNPESPNQRLEEYLTLLNYVLFIGVNPGWSGQPLNPLIYQKIGSFRTKYSGIPIAVDGHVDKSTIEGLVKAGATILCAGSAIFQKGNAVENLKQLRLLAAAAQKY